MTRGRSVQEIIFKGPDMVWGQDGSGPKCPIKVGGKTLRN